ncbi:hypothetical protein G6L28_10220 [Agrobacterium larrymoorei]|uniref:hypothetical protein n=1 Tax=Agrobacterium larrymoorei TaxID=160699 RepID=UPI001574722E|nr:hypothetical protein [Agrobacterium larrymoorei]NTJ42969.1 hypothetical protein [Agrobacterium larrymoorei]
MTIDYRKNAENREETPRPAEAPQRPGGDIEREYSSEPPWLALKMTSLSLKTVHWPARNELDFKKRSIAGLHGAARQRRNHEAGASCSGAASRDNGKAV